MMPDPNAHEIENLAYCKNAIAEHLARSIEGLSFASQFDELRDDATIFRAWRLSSPNFVPQIEQTLDLYTSAKNIEAGTEQKFVQDPHVDQVPVPGVFRQVQARSVKASENGKTIWYMVQVLREGYYQELNWASAKLVEAWFSDGNSSKITAPGGGDIANTTTDDPEEVLLIRFPNVDPQKLVYVAASVATSYTAPVVETHSFSGSWDKVIVHPQKIDDGSGVVDVIISRQKYTLNLFDRNNTAVEQRIGKMWGIPKKLAQSIVTAWDAGSGRSANGQLRPGDRLVDLVLTAATGTDNLTTSWIQINCDTYVRKHFAWGYTESELDAFIQAHDSAIGTTEDGRMITSRRIDQISTRGVDGLFDMIITEWSFGPHADPEEADVAITIPLGTKIEKQLSWGYNLRKSEITSDAFKETYNTDIALPGRTVEIQITREDDCSFDYYAVVTDQNGVISGDILADHTTGKGVRRKVTHLRGATTAEITAARVDATVTKSVDVDIEMRDDELAVGRISEKDVVATADSMSISGVSGMQHTFRVGSHQPSFPSLSAALLKDYSGEVSVTDAGGLLYHIHERTLVASDSTWNVGSRGRQVAMRRAHNQASLADPNIGAASAKGRSVELIPDFDSSGRLSYRLVDQQEAEQEVAVNYGDQTYKVEQEVHVGDVAQLDLDLKKFASAGEGVSYELRPSVNASGAAQWVLVKRTAQNNQPNSGAGFALSNLESFLNGFGFNDTTFPFRATKYDQLPRVVQDPVDRAEYYYYRKLQLNPDETFDGEYVEREYNGDHDGAITLGEPGEEGWTGGWDEYGPVQTAIVNSNLYTFQHIFTVNYKWTLDFGDVEIFLTGAGHSSRWMKVSLHGWQIFYAEKYAFANTAPPTLQFVLS